MGSQSSSLDPSGGSGRSGESVGSGEVATTTDKCNQNGERCTRDNMGETATPLSAANPKFRHLKEAKEVRGDAEGRK